MKVNRSARQHGVADEHILHAATSRAYESEPDDDFPAKQFVLGFDRHGRLLELVIVTFDSGNQLVIHAMMARRSVLELLD